MRILVVNPNTSASMTATIERCARASVGPGVAVDAVNPARGPISIESHFDEAIATPYLLEVVREGEAAGYDGFVVACFGDPGLLAAREVVSGPVVGIAEAAMRTAAYLTRAFSVVTTLPRVVRHTTDLAHAYGVERTCVGVHACAIPVVELETDPSARAVVLESCRAALERDGSEAIVLGCAGMADLCTEISAVLGVPVVDGVAAATAEVEKLVRLGLRTSKTGELAVPPAKAFA